MKSSIKGLVVILVIVMSFVLVQGVCARDLDDFEVATYEGVVTSVDAITRAIVLDTYPNDTFDQMGPLWYWDLISIKYPEAGDHLEITAFYCDFLGVYVGVKVCYLEEGNQGDCIDLRDDVTLKPLWNTKAKTTDLSDTAAEATGDGESNVPKDYEHDYSYSPEYNEPGPHGK